ncbi:MAG TPA: D-glycerate dehydrogenase [Candidatus Latescibacteria bacterium]|nr:D-glycerate dehydrogenase [Candidatus Latescibacterota bacterium]
MPTWNVFVTRRIPDAGLDLLRNAGVNFEVNPEDRVLTHEELLAGVSGRDGVLCLLTDVVDESVLEAARGARVFANYAVGYNNVDVAAATKRGIMVTNTPGVLTETTADMAWALIMATARRIVEGDRLVRAGEFHGWGPMMLLGMDVFGSTLGIVGAGRIGCAVARRAQGFGMKVLYTDSAPNPEISSLNAIRVDLDGLLKASDIVTLHVPLLEETRHLIGKREFALMKNGAILVNTSRGPVVDERALVEALKSGSIAGAGLDVYEDEPQLAPGLADCKNAVLTPHTASATIATRNKMAVMAATNLLAALRGDTPPNLVNPEVLTG